MTFRIQYNAYDVFTWINYGWSTILTNVCFQRVDFSRYMLTIQTHFIDDHPTKIKYQGILRNPIGPSLIMWWASTKSRPISRWMLTSSCSGYSALEIGFKCGSKSVTSGFGTSFKLFGMSLHSIMGGRFKQLLSSMGWTDNPVALLSVASIWPAHDVSL